MKKRILQIALASMFIFYASCSNESDVATQESGINSTVLKSDGLSEKELEDAILMYDAMIETAEYKAFELSLEEFNGKMNVENENMPTFVSKDDAMAWINNNLPNTNFSSVSDFEGDYDNLTGAMGNIMSNNMGLYNALSNASLEQTIEIMRPKYIGVEIPEVASECTDACLAAYNSGKSTADSVLNYVLSITKPESGDSTVTKYAKSLARAEARMAHSVAMIALKGNYKDCIKACD